MDISRNYKARRFGKNELGDQLQNAFFQLYDRARGIEVTLRIFSEAFQQADGSEAVLDQYDLADAHKLLAWISQRLTEDMGRYQEVLFSDSNVDIVKMMNRFDAKKDFIC